MPLKPRINASSPVLRSPLRSRPSLGRNMRNSTWWRSINNSSASSSNSGPVGDDWPDSRTDQGQIPVPGAHLERYHVTSLGVESASVVSVTCLREETSFHWVSFIHEETNRFR